PGRSARPPVPWAWAAWATTRAADSCTSTRGRRDIGEPPAPRLQSPQEGDQVTFLWLRQFQLQDQIEEFDRSAQRGQPAVVQVGRRVLDAAQRERLDRTIRGRRPAVDGLRFIEPLGP